MQRFEFPPARTHSPEETAALARALAPLLAPGDTLLLKGEIGAGKTHFARALIQARLRAAGRMEDVPSPTYTLVQTYTDNQAEIWHVDLYRICDVSELEELGLLAAFDEAICIVEWPERLGPLAPARALHLELQPGEGAETRLIRIRGDGAHWLPRIERALAPWIDV